jgi:hypothetical protein
MSREEVLRTTLHEAVLKLFELSGVGRPALIMAFTLPPNYDEVHWITNVTRKEGIQLMRDTATRMEAQQN